MLIAIAALAGCAATGGGSYPSLAKRPFEIAGGTPALPPAVPVTPTNAELIARVSGLLSLARASVTPFDEQLAKSRAPVAAASGAAESSEAWIAAQVVASRLETLLAPAANAAAAIGDEYRTLMQLPPGPDLAIVEQAFTEATAIADRQSEASADLTARLSR